MTKETQKIWSAPEVKAMATCIRVPVMRAHAESINLEFTNDIEEADARVILGNAPGVSLIDDRCARTSRMCSLAPGCVTCCVQVAETTARVE